MKKGEWWKCQVGGITLYSRKKPVGISGKLVRIRFDGNGDEIPVMQ